MYKPTAPYKIIKFNNKKKLKAHEDQDYNM